MPENDAAMADELKVTANAILQAANQNSILMNNA